MIRFFSSLPILLHLILLPIQLLFVGAIEYGFSRVQKSIEEDCSQYMDGLGWSAEKQGTFKNMIYTMGCRRHIGATVDSPWLSVTLSSVT